MNNEKIILIPCEVKSRDYKPRLLLTFFLAQAGFKVFFGRKAELEYFTRCFSNSIYIGLQSTNTYLNFYKKVKSNNNKLVLFDEEGIVTYSEKTYLKTKFNNNIAKICDIFFCWGEESYKLLANKRPLYKDKLVVVGNLRFDIIKKKFNFLLEEKSNLILKKFKKYILICCSFGNVNHFNKNYTDINYLKKINYLSDNQSVKDYKYYKNYNKHKFFENKSLIKFLAEKFKKINFIIRPHPSEKIESYYDLEKDFINVHVTNEFTVAEWLKWSKVNIHYYCTTSLEASAMGIENLAYNPRCNFNHLQKIPYFFSHQPNNLSKTKSLIQNILKKRLKKKKNKKIEKYIYNFYSKKAYVKIIHEIKKLYKNIENNKEYSKIDLNKKKFLGYKFLFKYFGKYTDIKSPNFIIQDIKKDLLKFRANVKNYKKIKVSKFQKNIFEISS